MQQKTIPLFFHLISCHIVCVCGGGRITFFQYGLKILSALIDVLVLCSICWEEELKNQL